VTPTVATPPSSRHVAILTPDPDETSWKDLPDEVYRRMAEPLAAAGLSVQAEPWTRASAEALARYAVVMPLVAWGYHFDLARFRSQLSRWQAGGVRLQNPASVLAWNADKRYLDDLKARGARTIPTLFCDRLGEADLVRAAERFGTEALVVKPQVSGAAWKTVKLRPGEGLDGAPVGPAMIQPFLPSIGEEGELSLFYFDRSFSHAVRKRPDAGDFRVQEQFGGQAEACAPEAEAMSTAEAVLAAIDEPLLYARVDLLRGLDGRWALIEIELIEPDLFLAYDRLAPDRFVAAVRGAAGAELEIC
jgi:glutathione synthase/RimK-type ligase-like ATP-grasp enzyme